MPLPPDTDKASHMSWEVAYGLQAGMVVLGAMTLYCAMTTPTLLCVAGLATVYWVYTRERRKAAGTLPLTGKTVLITGCDTGRSQLLFLYMYDRGYACIQTR